MISHNPVINCANARLYYYDFLSKETREGIPEDAVQHIKQCRNCQTEMDGLKNLLVKVDEKLESEQSRKDSAITTLLRLHFEYIGEPVKCETVKPFLASLADPVLQIRIPTPITTHLDKCKACCDDLQMLLELKLPHKYLCRLGQILADKPTEYECSCPQAQAAIPAVVSMAFKETNAEILKHLCTCPNCRKKLYLHRGSVRKKLLLNGEYQNGFPCESLSAAEIYDYCLPYGIDPADDQYVEFQKSLTSHLRKCPKCLAKMQQLHRTITDIAERAESEIITIYEIDESEHYAGFPAASEMAGAEDNVYIEQPKTINLTAKLSQKAAALNMKPLLKAGLAAAAVIAIGLALLLNSPAAKAVTLDQVYRAVEKVKNVYISKFGPDKAEPIQEMWVSRSLNIYMISNTSEGLVLLETAKKHKRTKQPGRASMEVKLLSDVDCAEIEKTMGGYLDLLPSDVPKDANWSRVADDDLRATEESSEVYELTWTDKTYGGIPEFQKRLYFVDPETGLPNKVELYMQSSTAGEYTLQSERIVKRLSDDEIRSAVKKVFP
ncbi:hypothetical protein ACFL3Q_08110 [Planctomycetota bacterium]